MIESYYLPMMMVPPTTSTTANKRSERPSSASAASSRSTNTGSSTTNAKPSSGRRHNPNNAPHSRSANSPYGNSSANSHPTTTTASSRSKTTSSATNKNKKTSTHANQINSNGKYPNAYANGGNNNGQKQSNNNRPKSTPPKKIKRPVVSQPPVRAVPEGEVIEHFNFSLIKRIATEGNWRRGYEYHLQRQVRVVELTPTGVVAKVKGRFKDFYNTQLHFTVDNVVPQCDCPLDEPWCKHAVAVALSTVEQQLWEAFWGLPEDEDIPQPLTHYEGRFQFQLFWPTGNHPAKGLEIRAIDREKDVLVSSPERMLKQVISQWNTAFPDQEMPRALKLELGIFQFLLQKGGKPSHRGQGWWFVSLTMLSDAFTLLRQIEDLATPEGHFLAFATQPLQLEMQVSATNTGAVQGAMHWVMYHTPTGNTAPQVLEELPLEELTYIGQAVPWAMRNQRIYPLSLPLAKLPPNLPHRTFFEYTGADSGRFVFEQLPILRTLLTVQDANLQKQLKEQAIMPVPLLQIDLIDESALRLRFTLQFQYEKTKVAFTKSTRSDSQYITIVNKKKDKVYWLQRQTALEQQAFDTLGAGGLIVATQGGALSAEGDDAVEVFNYLLPKLEAQGWQISKNNEAGMSILQLCPHPLEIVGRLEFDESVTHFTLQMSAQLGSKLMTIGDVQQHLLQGKKFFFMGKLGFVEVPLHKLLSFNRTIQAFDAEDLGTDRYKIPTYKAGLIAELEEMGISLDMSKKFRQFWDVLAEGKPMEALTIPKSVKANLRPYQERGFQWLWFLYSYGLNGILADDMGLGKTLQALVAIQQAKEQDGQFPSLIVCPTTLVFNWMNEIARFTPNLTTINLTGNERFELYPTLKDADIVVTSYAILRRDINAIKDYPFRFVILDESQHIKNAQAQTAMAAKLLNSQHRVALSGTPIENRLAELWSIFDFLMPDFLETFEEFRRRFILPIEERGNRDAERRLKKQVFPFILRRMKRDVLQDLPPKMEQVLYCDMTDNQRQLYLDILEKAREELMEEAIQKGGKLNQQHVFSALTRLRQLVNHTSLLSSDLNGGLHESGKFEALKELLTTAIANGHRILLFSQFVEMLKIVKQWFVAKGIKFEMLTGQTADRQGAVERFNNDESISVFLVSLKAGGTGLNLTGADCVIHYDPWWNPAAEDQATDRVHRIGQTKSVFVYRLIARNSIEEKIMKLKARKRSLVDSIISADRNIEKKLSLTDLKDILSID
jgi:superfamily II DNA or RNA helicase